MGLRRPPIQVVDECVATCKDGTLVHRPFIRDLAMIQREGLGQEHGSLDARGVARMRVAVVLEGCNEVPAYVGVIDHLDRVDVFHRATDHLRTRAQVGHDEHGQEVAIPLRQNP